MSNVCKKRCEHCLFGDKRLVTETDVARIIKKCAARDAHFICHEATEREVDVMCRGWWDEFRELTNYGPIPTWMVTPCWNCHMTTVQPIEVPQ